MKLNIERATKIAIESAKESCEKHRIGAILYQGNQYITGFNRTFNGVVVNGRRTPYSEHAEASVITHALHLGIDVAKSTLIVIRLNNKGSLRLAKPCKVCTSMIHQYNIKNVYFSNDPLHREFIPQNFKSLKSEK